MENTLRVIFSAPNCQFPASGTIGSAFTTAGYADPESAEYGAWLFFPDGDEVGYYCGREDLTPVEEAR